MHITQHCDRVIGEDYDVSKRRDAMTALSGSMNAKNVTLEAEADCSKSWEVNFDRTPPTVKLSKPHDVANLRIIFFE